MIKIGDLAKICNVSTQTLRYYDSEGILKADIIDSSSGYRFYSLDAIEKYKKILFYKSLGFSLSEIKIIQTSTDEGLKEILKRKKIVLSESIEKYKKHIETIDALCNENNRETILSDILLLPFEDDPQIVG
ncbi:MAG: MerR family transcriptional regulator, partial [Clostridia bacterium]|nr:MerR family transcriptional regulator [Clostridia bacterium]